MSVLIWLILKDSGGIDQRPNPISFIFVNDICASAAGSPGGPQGSGMGGAPPHGLPSMAGHSAAAAAAAVYYHPHHQAATAAAAAAAAAHHNVSVSCYKT